MAIKLIPDAQLSWRFWSTRATLLLGIVSSIQVELFPLVEPFFTAEQWRVVLPVWTVIIMVLRHIAQPGLEPARHELMLLESERTPAPDVAQQDVHVESMAMHLYLSTDPSKPWAEVSTLSRAKWRQVAAAALAVRLDLDRIRSSTNLQAPQQAPGAVLDTGAGAGQEHA